jgi:hypothetical protein
MATVRLAVFAGLIAGAIVSPGLAVADDPNGDLSAGAVGQGPTFSQGFDFTTLRRPAARTNRNYPGYPLFPPNYGSALTPPPDPLGADPAWRQPAPAEAHVAWCAARYRSYNPATDTFVGFDGFAHRCAAPY